MKPCSCAYPSMCDTAQREVVKAQAASAGVTPKLETEHVHNLYGKAGVGCACVGRLIAWLTLCHGWG